MNSLICLMGPGGVGKTTISASIALALAHRGEKVVLLTVDPAKRLAQVLGIDQFSEELKTLPLESSFRGSLSAYWANGESAFEKLIDRHIGDSPAAKKIKSHSFFPLIKKHLTGVEDYLALEKIIQLYKKDEYTYFVLDTPPARHAVEFLNSPARLENFFDDRVLKYFQRKSDKSSFLKKWIESGTRHAFSIFQKVFGENFFSELADLLGQFGGLGKKLHQNSQVASQWLSSSNAFYYFVARPESSFSCEILPLINQLKSTIKANASGLLLNQSYCGLLNNMNGKTNDRGDTQWSEKQQDFIQYTTELENQFDSELSQLAPSLNVSKIEKRPFASLDLSELNKIGQKLLKDTKR